MSNLKEFLLYAPKKPSDIRDEKTLLRIQGQSREKKRGERKKLNSDVAKLAHKETERRTEKT
jgi:hypothetical protein